EGETVAVNAVVATIGEAGEAVAAAAARVAAPRQGAATAAASTQRQPDGEDPAASGRRVTGASATSVGAPEAGKVAASNGQQPLSKDDLRRQKSSPLVRRIAREHNVDISGLHGSGIGGRVTKHDILEFLEHPASPPPAASTAPGRAADTAAPVAAKAPAHWPAERVDVQPLSVMRKKIAEHMILSRRTSA